MTDWKPDRMTDWLIEHLTKYLTNLKTSSNQLADWADKATY